MELPDFLQYLKKDDIEPKPITELPPTLQYLQKEDLEITTMENIIKMTRNYLNYNSPLLYRLYLHFNTNLSPEEKTFYENKIIELEHEENTKYSTLT